VKSFLNYLELVLKIKQDVQVALSTMHNEDHDLLGARWNEFKF